MKKLLILIFLWPQISFAEKAMVIVLEAPIFKEPSIDAKIVQYARKGSVIYVDRRDLKNDPTALTQRVITFDDFTGKTEIPIPASGKQRWYKTLDRNGQDAYILGPHIKVIYNDFREFNEKVSIEGHDPTDYRLTEPLPAEYPFTEGHEFRFNITLGVGPSQKSYYNYNAPITREDYRVRSAWGLNVYWPEGLFNHFRFGLNVGMYIQMRKFLLEDGRSTFENGGSLSLGPSINYDQFKGKTFQITYSAGLNFNYARYFVEQETLNHAIEERAFSGVYLTPKIFSTFQWKKVFFDSVDLLGQFEAIFDYPHSYTSRQDPVIPPMWNANNDTIFVPGGATFLVYIGLQAKI